MHNLVKKKVFIVITILCTGITLAYTTHKDKKNISDIILSDIESIAQNNEKGENKFVYYTWMSQDCYVYVGGAYAKGKKVDCREGDEHPICVDCQL